VNLGSRGITVYEIDENEACEKAKLRNIILLKPAINLMGCSTSSDVLFFFRFPHQPMCKSVLSNNRYLMGGICRDAYIFYLSCSMNRFYLEDLMYQAGVLS
jgi:hypothetical protein